METNVTRINAVENSLPKALNAQTFRIRGIPPECIDHAQVVELLMSDETLAASSIVIKSLAIEACKSTRTATATFAPTPIALRDGIDQWTFNCRHMVLPRAIPFGASESGDCSSTTNERSCEITIDTHFRGITTLNSFEIASDHKLDCVAITGLGGHAFGSFKERGGTYMWLRDSLPHDLPGARVMIYGFDTRLQGSRSSQNLESLASAFRNHLKLIEQSTHVINSTPLVFFGFSLGGLVIKEAIIQMKNDPVHCQALLKSIYGILFFGVPNQGLNIESLIPMAEGQPNESFLHSLGTGSQLLQKQCRDFTKAFDFPDSEVLCFYELLQSRSATFEASEWKMNGPYTTLVDSRSATHGRPWENEPHHIQGIQRTHSELVKFSRYDPDYDLVLNILLGFISRAREVIRRRLGFSAAKSTSLIRDFAEYSLKERECLKSFSYQGMYTRQDNVESPILNTCQWFWNTQQCLQWKNRQHLEDHLGFLWIKGNPGSGKSVLMKSILKEFRHNLKIPIILSFFFNGRGSSMDQAFVGLLKSLLHQLLPQNSHLFAKILVDFQKKETSEEKWDWQKEELKSYFIDLIATLEDQAMLILVDALDECAKEEMREVVSFLQNLTQLASTWKTTIFVCLASRHYPHITVSKCFEIAVQNHNQKDIEKYVYAALQLTPQTAEQRLGYEVVEKASGNFLWAVLVCKKLAEIKDRGGTIKKMQSLLQNIPEQLKDVFRQCFDEIDPSDREKALRLTQWVLFAKRPLQLQEIQYALGFSSNVSHRSHLSFQESDEYLQDEEQVRRMVRHLSVGLVEIVPESLRTFQTFPAPPTEQSRPHILQFIHESVRDFLLQHNAIHILDPTFGSDFVATSEDHLCRACLNYLKIEEVKSLTRKTILLWGFGFFEYENSERMTQVYPFLEYATSNCFLHSSAADHMGKDQSYLNAQFYEDPRLMYHVVGGHPSVSDFLEARDDWGPSIQDFLITASYHQIWTCVTNLLTERKYANFTEVNLTGTLRHILNHGPEPVVELLLQRATEIQVSASFHREALWIALRSGREAVLKSQLETNINPNERNSTGNLPICRAAANGHLIAVKLLVEKGALLNEVDPYGRTALFYAARGGFQPIVRLLLESGADLNIGDKFGVTAVSAAAIKGHEDIAKVLLEHGVYFQRMNKSGWTELHWATFYRKEGVASILLQRGATVDRKATLDGWLALRYRKVHIVDMDIDRENFYAGQSIGADAEAGLQTFDNIHAEIKQSEGWSSLQWAAYNGYDDMVRLLLKHGASSEIRTTPHGWTVRQLAERNGHQAVVNLLDSNVQSQQCTFHVPPPQRLPERPWNL